MALPVTRTKNKKDVLKVTDLRLLDRQPSNFTFHNITGNPCGSEQLLGLSLKFCVQEKIPVPQVTKTLARLRRAARLRAVVRLERYR
jgi:hypothetical protein